MKKNYFFRSKKVLKLFFTILGLHLFYFVNNQVQAQQLDATFSIVGGTRLQMVLHQDATFEFSESYTNAQNAFSVIIKNVYNSKPSPGGFSVASGLSYTSSAGKSGSASSMGTYGFNFGPFVATTDEVIAFTLAPGATISSGETITIPSGTIIQSLPGSYGSGQAFNSGSYTAVIANSAFDGVAATMIASSSNTAPLIGGTTSGQSVNDNATISPFSAITTTDADGDNLSATITLDNNAKGVLTGTGLTGTGPYTIASTTPTDLQAKLRALSFNPTDNRTSTTETTTFTVVVNDGTVDDTDNTTTVISSAVAPAVSSVGVPANATYVSGQNLDFTVNFNENVTVNTTGGTPQIAITIGSTVRQAVYQSGSGTSALLFRYTVQTGELDTDGVAVGTLAANGGTLKDSGGTDADLTLNSVGSTTAVLVDGVAPTVSSVSVPSNATYVSGQNLDFTVNFNENVTVNTTGGTPQIAITIGSTVRQAVYQSGSGTSALLFRYTVQTGELDTDGVAVGTLAANGGTLKDAAGNDADLTLNSVGSTTAVLVDGVAPTVSSVSVPSNATYVSGQNLDFTVNFNENVTVNTTGGTPQIAITIGSTVRQAVYQSGSGTSALLFRYTVQTGELDTDGITVGTLAANGGTLKDAAGNDADLTLNSVGSTTAVLVDGVVPTVSSVSVPSNATYVSGQNLDFTVNFNENVTVNTTGGTPQMVITIGSTVRQAVYQSGSGTSALLFRYTVQTGELDTDGITVGTLAANGGTLKDSGGTDADLTLNSVGSTTAVLVDGVAPAVSSVGVPANATYVSGQNLDFTVNFNENVTVNTTGGTPQIAIIIGSTVRQAVYQSGSGTSALLFRYTVQTGELDTDGIAVGTLAANGGTLKDAAYNDADLTLNSVGSTTAVLVDALTTATLTTADAGSVDSTTVTLGGETTADGGASITERGVVYAITGTNNNPTIGGTGVTKEDNGSGIGVFSEPITGLTANTQYSYAAYAINSKGTSYGTVKTFTTASLGVEQDILQKSISVYPNPVVNALRVDAGRAIEVENIEVYDISGKLLKTLKQTNKTIDFSSMHSGSYFVKINTNQGSLTKLIVKK